MTLYINSFSAGVHVCGDITTDERTLRSGVSLFSEILLLLSLSILICWLIGFLLNIANKSHAK